MGKQEVKSEVVAVKPGALVEAGAFEEFAGAGLGGLGKDDLAIPFLTILQSNSPQVKRSDGEYVEGAQEGMLFNTVTKQLIDTATQDVYVVACAYELSLIHI